MSSLNDNFNEVLERIRYGREFGHASFEPVYYLVFPPREILEVKRLLPAWKAKLQNKEVLVEDPYVRMPHQIQNFVRFCEVVVKAATVKRIRLITSYDDNLQMMDVQNKLAELQQSLLEIDIVLDVELNPNLHDREIRLDNGWVIKIGRGLDFYQKPDSWFGIGASDLSLRPCLETKVDIFRAG